MSKSAFTPCRFCGDLLDPGEGDVCNEADCQTRLGYAKMNAKMKAKMKAMYPFNPGTQENRVSHCMFCEEPFDPDMSYVGVCDAPECLSRHVYALVAAKKVLTIPRRYRGGFDTFPTPTAAHKAVVERGKKWAAGFSRKTSTGLWVWGKLGSGKSGLAFSILKAVAERGFRVAWVNVAELIESYQATFGGDGSPRAIRRELLEHDLILLDDFGVESATPYAAQCVYMLVEQMARDERPVCIATSNFSLNQFIAEYKGGDGRDNIMRAMSRLRQIVREFDGLPPQNLRERKEGPGA